MAGLVEQRGEEASVKSAGLPVLLEGGSCMKDELDKIETALRIAIQTVDKLREQGAYQEALALR